jgi:hypothetical protein
MKAECSSTNVLVEQRARSLLILTIHGQHHPRADIHRLYNPRRGLMQIQGAYTAELIKLEEYVERKEYLSSDADCLDTPPRHTHDTISNSHQLQEISSDWHKANKNTIARNLKKRREAKRLHGQFPRSLDEGMMNKEQSCRWLKLETLREKQKAP